MALAEIVQMARKRCSGLRHLIIDIGDTDGYGKPATDKIV